jgi:peptide-methionine (R)-S-oxide reductase
MMSDSEPNDRRRILGRIASFAAVVFGAAWFSRWRPAKAAEEKAAEATKEFGRLELPKSRWKELLPEKAYAVLFEEATERPFSSPLNEEKRAGTFVCAACFLPLFSSKAKFDSGTGWPSFFEPLPGRVGTKRDFALILPRTEYHCARCDGHQGHVFDDGPPPTGLRYCNNGLALRFVPEGEALPALRQAS